MDTVVIDLFLPPFFLQGAIGVFEKFDAFGDEGKEFFDILEKPIIGFL